MNNHFTAPGRNAQRPAFLELTKHLDGEVSVAVGDCRFNCILTQDEADRLTGFLVSHGYGTQKVPAEAPVETVATSKDVEELYLRLDALTASMNLRYTNIGNRFENLDRHIWGLERKL